MVTVADDGGSQRPAARASSACCRRATCGWRWPRCAATTSGAAPGPTCCSTGSAATGALPATRSATCCIVALWELLGDPVAALDWSAGCSAPAAGCCRWRPCRWRSRPRSSALDPTDPDARATVRGQVAVATTPGPGRVVRLVPADPPACPEAVDAVHDADWVVLGPGSWFTSVLPHLLVPELREALAVDPGPPAAWRSTSRRSRARPTGSRPSRTSRCSPATRRTCELDVVLADPRPWSTDEAALRRRAPALGATPRARPGRGRRDGTGEHDPLRVRGRVAGHCGAPETGSLTRDRIEPPWR